MDGDNATPRGGEAEKLREALEPFAREADAQERVTNFRDGDCIIPRTKITIGQLRRARAVLASPPPVEGLTSGEGDTAPLYSFDEAWSELVEKDDRTSPEEYPDMCLITRDELRCYMEARQYALAASPATHAGSVREECAAACDQIANDSVFVGDTEEGRIRHEGIIAGARNCAIAIRAALHPVDSRATDGPQSPPIYASETNKDRSGHDGSEVA